MKHPPLTVELPFPPSVNGYWRSVCVRKGRRWFPNVYISDEGKQYRDAVRYALFSETMKRRQSLTREGRLAVCVFAWMPDKLRRDVDNLCKALLDACTAGKLWNDDNQVRDLRIVNRGIVRGGKIVMRVRSLERMLF